MARAPSLRTIAKNRAKPAARRSGIGGTGGTASLSQPIMGQLSEPQPEERANTLTDAAVAETDELNRMMNGGGGEPEAPAAMNDKDLVQWVLGCQKESEDASRDRMRINRRNRDANLGRQDWSGKMPGQSREFLPKVRMAGEQFAAFVKRALTQFGPWFQIDARTDMPTPMREEKMSELLLHMLDNIYIGNGRTTSFATMVTDGVKLGLFEAEIILKIHGEYCAKTRHYVEPGGAYVQEDGTEQAVEEKLATKTLWPWKLRVDLIRPDYYFPDTSGRGLYDIHETERDLYQIVDMAEKGVYDAEVVAQISQDFTDAESELREARAKGQRTSQPAAGRKRVKLLEYWGTVLDRDGMVSHRNIVMTVANDKYLIRPPEPNPFWHGMCPILAVPLVRVPLSVRHMALYDDAVMLNMACNELFNMMLDGGLAAIWGVRQVRVDDLENPEDISDGIPQGKTLAVKSSLPYNAKVVEAVSTGQVPAEAMAVFEALSREFNQAALTNDVKLGTLPSRAVTATEVNDASNSQTTTLDAIASDLERELLVKALTQIFLVTMQHLGEMDSHEVVAAIGPAATLALARMSDAQRYAAFGNAYNFKVYGLSSVMTRARDFQRMMALLQAVTTNPLLMQSFMKKFSPDKTLRQIMKMLNINPDSIQITPEEQAQLGQTIAMMPMMMQMTGQGGSGGGRADGGGTEQGGPMPAEINQMQNPVSGMGGG